MVVPPSPVARRLRAPSWLDSRLLVGVALVAVSTAAGTKVVSAADSSVQVWALERDVAAGTVLTADDVRPARVRLFESAPLYLGTADSPAGRSVDRGLRAGELLPVAALRVSPPGVIVNIPVQPKDAPAVARGHLVDVWATGKGCPPTRVLAGAAVQDVRDQGVGALSGAPGALQVVVRVGGAEAERLLAALGGEATIRLVVLDGAVPGPAGPLPVACTEARATSTSGPTGGSAAGAPPDAGGR